MSRSSFLILAALVLIAGGLLMYTREDTDPYATQRQLVVLADDLQQLEQEQAALNLSLSGLETLEELGLNSDPARYAQLSSALLLAQRLSLMPEARVVQESGQNAATTRIMLRGLVDALTRTAVIATDDEVGDLRQDAAGTQQALDDVNERLEAIRREADALMATLRADNDNPEAVARADALAGPASGHPDKGELVAGLTAEELAAEPQGLAVFPSEPGGLKAPVAAVPAFGFGEGIDPTGAPAEGLTYSVPGQTTVVSPFDGIVAFAAPFRSYGDLIMIEHSGRRFSLLFGQFSGRPQVGQPVLRGQPVARLSPDPFGDETAPRRLYFELRIAGKPVDPEVWIVR